MSRYAIKFNKEGVIRYISHLDLLRLFKRSFKRVEIKLQYSQGFNPHPKMSFAQPLSLGYTSSAELLEFDTVNPHLTDEIVGKLNTVMPEGIRVLSCEELPKEGRSLAALTNSASYEILIPVEDSFKKDCSVLADQYLSQQQIKIMKHQRKSGKDIEVDIKPMIFEMNGMVDNNLIMITCKIAAGSTENLSPEMVLSTFCDFAGISYDRADILINRTRIYFSN